MIREYRKKPVVVEAALWHGSRAELSFFEDWIGPSKVRLRGNKLEIATLEGKITAAKGDYIIKGVKGEFYPCKPDIFKATYLDESDAGNVSDGFHTFNELYQHRIALFIALMLTHPQLSWRSRKHADGSFYDDWFIAGMHLPTGDITYHLPNKDWDKLGGGKVAVATLETAPEFDSHTPADVVNRLEKWMKDYAN